MIFQSSTWLTELITAGKYPEYSRYRDGVGMFFPKSIRSYQSQTAQRALPLAPKVIRTSEIAKRMEQKEKQKQKQKQK
jgi:hypothetical protein